MATIILNYNTRNVQAQKALDYILSLGVFRAETIRRQRRRPAKSINPFAEVRGIWADRGYVETHLASETVLAKDWLNAREDAVWKDL